MRFVAIAETDIGTVKTTNQDSILIRQASYEGGEVLLAVVCDGMGGLAKGELASATVVRAFNEWFDTQLPYELVNVDLSVIGCKWELMLRALNLKIGDFGNAHHVSLGTTFSAILMINNDYLIGHVGDSRVYSITNTLTQLTTDHSFVAREIARGNMTPEQAKTDKRRNLLLQCVGASAEIDPQILSGKISKGAYMLCSDGFRHEITENEMYELLNPVNLINKDSMHANVRYLIECVKERKEKDNISVILIKVN